MSQPSVALVVHGAAGKMGRAVIGMAGESEDTELLGCLDLRPGTVGVEPHALLRELVTPRPVGGVVVDFTHPDAIGALLRALQGSGWPLVSGTTGLGAAQREKLKEYAQETAVFYDENMSYGISLMKELLGLAARKAGELGDIEIVEIHHRDKRDAPSGTALALAKTIEGNVRRLPRSSSPSRAPADGVPVHSVRIGGVHGEHRVYLGGREEVLTVSHRALSRDVFARGAIEAARFVAGRQSGFFTMEDLVRDRVD